MQPSDLEQHHQPIADSMKIRAAVAVLAAGGAAAVVVAAASRVRVLERVGKF